MQEAGQEEEQEGGRQDESFTSPPVRTALKFRSRGLLIQELESWINFTISGEGNAGGKGVRLGELLVIIIKTNNIHDENLFEGTNWSTIRSVGVKLTNQRFSTF